MRRPAAIVVTGVFVVSVVAACGGSPSRRPSHRSSATTTTGTATNPPGRLRTTGPIRHLDGAFFGFNGASIIQNPNIDLLLDPTLQRRLAGFPARLIRVPSGTAAQWIDWQSGKFVDRPDSPFSEIDPNRHPVTMADWATLLRTAKAMPVWDLNVLTSSLEDQLAMLDEATRLGLAVRYIELGNELWDARSIYPKVYPTGADYATAMNRWIPVLRARFPDAQVAVSGADPSDPFFSTVFGARYRDWNAQVLATIRGVDAIAIHPYWTLPGRIAPGSDIGATLRAGLDNWHRVEVDTLSRLPDGMRAWLTEWNQAAWASSSGAQIWAQALSVAAVGISQLTSERVAMSLVHNIVDGVRNPQDAGISTTFPVFSDGAGGSTPLARTALGHALPLLFAAVSPGAAVQRLEVVPGADESNDQPGVVGVRVSGARPGAVLVNLTDRPLHLGLPDEMDGRWRATSVSAAPDAQPGWRHGDDPTVSTADVSADAVLPAFSVTRLSRK